MVLQTGIFGYPIGHSVSPAMHQAAFDHFDIAATYIARETLPEALSAGIANLREEGWLGANVTVPHKLAVMAGLDTIDGVAQEIGAVNTIVKRDGRLFGMNTDTYGFLKPLGVKLDSDPHGADATTAVTPELNPCNFDPRGADATLIGAGGAARAAAHALAGAGARTLIIANRTPERAEALASEIDAKPGVSARGIGLNDPDFPDVCAGSALIVNSSSVGMLGGPAEGVSPVPLGAISPGCVVYDMVYNPMETPLLAQAADAGAQTVGGLPMLVHQGAAAWSEWTREAAPINVMFKAAKDELEGWANPNFHTVILGEAGIQTVSTKPATRNQA